MGEKMIISAKALAERIAEVNAAANKDDKARILETDNTERFGWIMEDTHEYLGHLLEGLIRSDELPPVGYGEFKEKAELFVEELNRNLLSCSIELNEAFLRTTFQKCCRWHVEMSHFRQLTDAGLWEEAQLLEYYRRYSQFVCNLLYDHNNVLWEDNSGLIKYRDELLSRQFPDPPMPVQPELPPADGHGNNLTDEQGGGDNTAVEIPDELNTDKAKELFQKAIDAGLISVTENGYQWKKTKALLAYFADLANEHLKLGKGEYGGKAKISWKPFESLFGVSGLAGARLDYQKDGRYPDGYDQVDSLFK